MNIIKFSDSVDSLIIGVTGHRNIHIEDLPSIRIHVKNTLYKIQSNHQNLKLITGLAEGADRLVAKIAYDLNIPFSAILPMKIDDYISDFQTIDSINEFNHLLSLAYHIDFLPTQHIQMNNSRNLCYQQLANYIANNSKILIALWDGNEIEKPGGTSQVVRYFKELTDSNHYQFEHILTRRMS